MPTFWLFSRAINSNSRPVSRSVSEAVGSSRMSKRTRPSSALAISAICWCARELSHLAGAQHAFAGDLAAEEQVFLYRETWNEREFLEHRADADRARALRREMADLLAAEPESAFVGR